MLKIRDEVGGEKEQSGRRGGREFTPMRPNLSKLTALTGREKDAGRVEPVPKGGRLKDKNRIQHASDLSNIQIHLGLTCSCRTNRRYGFLTF